MIGPWGPLGRGVEHFWGWGYSLSWIGQLPFVFAWASSNVVQYLGDRLAHVLMQNCSNRPRGFYTVAKKYDNLYFFWQFLEFISLYLRNDKEYRTYSIPKIKVGISPVQLCHLYWRIFPQLSTGWVKVSLVQFCNLNFFDNFWSLLPCISETTENLGTQWIPEIKAGFSPVHATVPFIPAYLSWNLYTVGQNITGTILFFFAIRSFVSDIWAKREQINAKNYLCRNTGSRYVLSPLAARGQHPRG